MEQLTGYVASLEYQKQLENEILLYPDLKILKRVQNFFLVQGPIKKMVWSQNQWLNPIVSDYQSIKQAQSLLIKNGRHWHLTAAEPYRRAELVCNGLPAWKIPEFSAYQKLPTLPLGSFVLPSEKEIIFSSDCEWNFPDGKIPFKEDHINPPSRAYLKLWEVFTKYQIKPTQQQLCIDLGACPGGWTWVLVNLGAKVISVDRSELRSDLMENKNIQFYKKDAFQLLPNKVDFVPDWIFSDLICYPEKLLEFIGTWLQTGQKINFICTIKFQGVTDYQITKKFLEIPGSSVHHLWANKHEVTWMLIQK